MIKMNSFWIQTIQHKCNFVLIQFSIIICIKQIKQIIKQNLRLVYQISCRYITKIGVYDISDLIFQNKDSGIMIPE